MGTPDWEPEFKPSRQVAYRKYFWRRYIDKPTVKRFYHEIVDLRPEEWTVNGECPLFSGFCRIKYELTIFFQASLEYLVREYKGTYVSDLNEEIKRQYEPAIKSAVMNKLKELEDNIGLLDKVQDLGKEIAALVIRLLAENIIMSQVNCELAPPTFVELEIDRKAGEISADFIYEEMFNRIREKDTKFRESYTHDEAEANRRIRDVEQENKLADERAELAYIEEISKQEEKKREFEQRVEVEKRQAELAHGEKLLGQKKAEDELERRAKEEDRKANLALKEETYKQEAEETGLEQRFEIAGREAELAYKKEKSQQEQRNRELELEEEVENGRIELEREERKSEREQRNREIELQSEKSRKENEIEMTKIRTETDISNQKENERKAIVQHEVDMAMKERQVAFDKEELELLDLRKQIAEQTSELSFISASGEKKIEELEIRKDALSKVLEKRAENILEYEKDILEYEKDVLEYERQGKLIEILPKVFAELDLNAQKIDQFRVLQFGSPDSSELGNIINPISQVVQSVKAIKEILGIFVNRKVDKKANLPSE